MSDFQIVSLCPSDAAALVDRELAGARAAGAGGDVAAAVGAYVRSLGVGLQLGPALCEQVLRAVLRDTLELDAWRRADGLPALGPAIVDLVNRVEEADALPETPVMEAWASIAADLGALLGQVGIALSMPAERRFAVLDPAHRRAAMLDDATNELFGLAAWLNQING